MVDANDYEPTLEITRELDAPRALVFEVWTKPEHLEPWFGPIGFTTRCTMDFRVGGSLSITLSGYGMVSTVSGVYREIVRPERIVQAMRFTDLPDHEMVQTITFAERGGKTLVTMRHTLPAWDAMNDAQRALILPRSRGARMGWTQTLQHLADYVAKQLTA